MLKKALAAAEALAVAIQSARLATVEMDYLQAAVAALRELVRSHLHQSQVIQPSQDLQAARALLQFKMAAAAELVH